jgi:hypothetical protein
MARLYPDTLALSVMPDSRSQPVDPFEMRTTLTVGSVDVDLAQRSE